MPIQNPDVILCDRCKITRLVNPDRKYTYKELNDKAANAGWDVLFETTHICPRCTA